MINVFIFHGTEGYPEENWFPWMKEKLEAEGCKVIVPQFPTPPIVPAKISEWFDVLKKYENEITEDTILIGHSLGGIFLLRVLEKLNHPVREAVFVGAPIGERPILNYDRDEAFSGFNFDWENIKNKTKNFIVYQSDNDPYVGLENGKALAKNLGVDLTFIPNAGHFNTKAGYTEFPDLLEKIKLIIKK
jgi:predicted alpha/beta hydrolase family esterase